MISTLSSTRQSKQGVRSLLVLPPLNRGKRNDSEKYLPNLVTGGDDYRLRFWNLNTPDESTVLAWEGSVSVPKPRVTFWCDFICSCYYLRIICAIMDFYILLFSEMVQGNTKLVYEYDETPASKVVPNQHSSSAISSLRSTSDAPSHIHLEMGEVTVGHTNIISDMVSVTSDSGCNFLVSAAMNGVIKIWK